MKLRSHKILKPRSLALGLCVLPALAVLGGASSALAADAVCLTTTPPPTHALITYGGKIAPVTEPIGQIIPGYCIRITYGGGALWTRSDASGGVTCSGNNVQVDYGTANRTFNNYRTKNAIPAPCGPASPPPTTPPPEATAGSRVNVFYGTTIDMAQVPVKSVSAACYLIDYSGKNMWFPKGALGYRTVFVGNPVALDYNQRRFSAC